MMRIFARSLLCLFILSGCMSTKKHGAQIASAEDDNFRDYENAPQHVKDFYAAQHKFQTLDFVKSQHGQFDKIMNDVRLAKSEQDLARLEELGVIKRMTLWQALESLDDLVDESDPDLDLPNSIHALQSAEAIRRDLKFIASKHGVREEEIDWLVLVGLIHDIGKVDALLRKTPQWAVVGDTFPLGCAFAQENIFANTFVDNPDYKNPLYSSRFGIYKPQVGLDNLVMAWGHDEYASRVLKAQGILPKAAISMIRFHSFYPMHLRGAYRYLLDPKQDAEQLAWIKVFNPYDLYSKSKIAPNKEELQGYYKKLINKYFVPGPNEDAKKIIWPVLAKLGS